MILKKTTLVTLLIIVLTLNLFAQVPKEKAKQSNIETFSEQSGSFSKKEFIELGRVSGLSISIIRITDLISNKTITGIRFSGSSGGTYSTEKIAFLDKDEVASFLKSVTYLNEKVFDSPLPINNEEYNYYARGSFSGGAFSSKKEWSGYISLDKYSDSTFFFKKEDFKKIVEILQQNLTKL